MVSQESVIIPITCFRCLCVPRFLVAWNIHGLCNLPCATHGIVRYGIATPVRAMHATHLGKYLTMTNCKNAMKQL